VRTFQPKPSDLDRAWHVVDAEGAILGRLSTDVATLLRGKHKATWAPHADVGDHVIVINASRLDIGPRKGQAKRYWRHPGYPGAIRSESLERLLQEVLDRPELNTREQLLARLHEWRAERGLKS